MGTWGYEAWDSDEAVDWFKSTFNDLNLDNRIEEALRYSDEYGRIRAVGYLLSVLAHSSYVWPGDPDLRTGHIQKALSYLREMIDPDSDSDFLALWDSDPQIVAQVQSEIASLEAITS